MFALITLVLGFFLGKNYGTEVSTFVTNLFKK